MAKSKKKKSKKHSEKELRLLVADIEIAMNFVKAKTSKMKLMLEKGC